MDVCVVSKKKKEGKWRAMKTKKQVRMKYKQSTREYKKKPRWVRGFSHRSGPVLGPFFKVKRLGWGVALAIHPHLAPGLKRKWNYTSAPFPLFGPSWPALG
jgi:hypothetical protein